MAIHKREMNEQYIDVLKVWSVNLAVFLSNKMIETFGSWNEAIQALLTTILLLASVIYTFYKIINIQSEIEERKDDTE